MQERNGISSSCKKYNLPRSTLYNYVRSNFDHFQATQSKLGSKAFIPPAPEEKFLEYLLLIERRYLGRTRDDVRRPVFQLAVQNKIPSPFSNAKEAAGKDWLKRCMKRPNSCRCVNQEKHPLPEPQDSARNTWRFALSCTKKSLLLMITHFHLFST